MKKIVSILLTIVFLCNITLPTVYAASYVVSEKTRPVTLSNEIIKLSVNNKGRFNIRSTELGNPIRPDDSNKTLLFYGEENETSFATFRIDGEDYIFGEKYAYSLSRKAQLIGETVKTSDSIVTTYKIGTGTKVIEVIQTLSIVNDPSNTNYGNVYIKYSLNNYTGTGAQIGARILQDVMIGDNDGCAIKVGDNFYDKEIELTGNNIPDIWRATDNEFAPSVVAYGYTNGWGNIKPNRLIIGHWQGLSQTTYDYTVDNTVNFTIESDYGRKDTAIAYYWDPKTVKNNETISFETYFGLGQIFEKKLTYATNISAPTQMVLNADKTGYVDNGEFEVAVTIENNLPNSEEIYDVMAYLTFEDTGNAVSLNNDVALKGTKLVKVGGQYTFRWKLKAKPGVDYNAIRYKVDMYDRRNVYKEDDIIPEGSRAGDVKLNEIYSVSKALILPSKTGAPPKISFGTISPNELYYSGKNLVTVNCTGIPLLVNKEQWELQYRVNNGDYKVVPSNNINVIPDTNSLEIMFEEQFDVGEMEFRIKILNNLYTMGEDKTKHILKDDILNMPGKITITKDKSVMPRTYGMLAIVSDFSFDEYKDFSRYNHVIPLADEKELKALEKALEDANKKDKEKIGKTYEDEIIDREVLMVIRGDIRAIKDDGELSKYVVYAQNKKAIINNVITYASAVPLTIQYITSESNRDRDSIEYFLDKNDAMSDTLRDILEDDTTIPNNFSKVAKGELIPGIKADIDYDFSYEDELIDYDSTAKKTMDAISGFGDMSDKLSGLVSNDLGALVVTGLGVLGINSGDGFDFWRDMFVVKFEDNLVYSLWDLEDDMSPVQFELGGIGAVLNKALDGMPVQIGGVRLVQDRDKELDMLTFDATVDLKMFPGGVVVGAEDIFFSTRGYEGLIINASAKPEKSIGMISDMELEVGVDTYNGAFSIIGAAQIKVVKCNIEFSMMKESQNDTWYLSDCVLAGGGKPGIPLFGGAAYITKLGGGVRNLQTLTNPYFDDPEALFTIVTLMDLNVVDVLEGSFEGQFTKRYLQIGAEEATIKGLDIFRDLEGKLCWDTGTKEKYYLTAKGSIDIEDIFKGDAKLYISDIFFEGTCKLAVKIPGDVPIVGGKSIGSAIFGVDNNKMWGSMGIDLLIDTVEVGATYWWRNKWKFNIGEAGPIEDEAILNAPTGGLYEGTTLDNNGEKLDYIIGTNVEKQEGKIVNSSFKEMQLVANAKSEDIEYIGNKIPLNIVENKYHHNELDLTDKYVYDIKLDVTENTKLVFEYMGQTAPNITICSNTKTKDDEDNTDIIENTSYTLHSVSHVYADKNYQTLIGFEDNEAAEFVVVSDVELNDCITYTDTISEEMPSDYVYEVTMDTTDKTKLAFSHNGDLEVDIYEVTGTTFDGKAVIGDKCNSLTQSDIEYGDKKIRIIEGFEVGLKDKKILVSSNKELTSRNVIEAYIVDVKSNSDNESNIIAEFVSLKSIKDADVFYMTDQEGNIVKLPEGDINKLYGEREINSVTYSTMLFPFENEGKYYIYSSAKLEDKLSKVYEIEKMPQLEKDSVKVKENGISSQKLDISWEGSNYRYTADKNKKIGRTIFSFYLVEDNNIVVDKDGQLEDETGELLGLYNIKKDGVNSYTIDIPKGTPTGNYRIKTVLGTEGLCQRFEYSDVIKYVNPNTPKKVRGIDVSSIGNGLLDVSWQETETVEEYYVEVFDKDKNIMDSFGVASVDGDTSQVIIGGVYETYNPKNPDKSTVAGLETEKDYIVGITPVKRIDDDTRIVGETAYSDKIFLKEPTPPEINIDFNEKTFNRIESSYGVNEDGKAIPESVEVKGINNKAPLITIKTDSDCNVKILLDKVVLQSTKELSNKVELQLNKLTEGVHYLDVIAQNEYGDLEHESMKFYVDTRAPELLLDTPVNNQYIPSDASSIVVSGRTEVGAEVKINDIPIPVNEKGVFKGSVPIDTDTVKTVLKLESEDDFGNITKNKTEVIRNISPIKDIVITTDIPKVTKNIKKPMYEVTMERMKNAFTGELVDVPITTDEVIGYEQDVLIENIVKMGESYKIDVKGIAESSLATSSTVSSADYVDIDKSKLKYEIVEGKTLASIDDNGNLVINNNGLVVVKALYEVLSDKGDEEGYSFEKYITMNCEYADIYADSDDDDKDDDNNDNDNNNDETYNYHDEEQDDKTKKDIKDKDKIYTERDKVKDSIYVSPTVFKDLQENNYEHVIIDTDEYTIVLQKTLDSESTVANNDSKDSLLSIIPKEELLFTTTRIPLSSIDMSLTLDSPIEEEILKEIKDNNISNNDNTKIVHFRHHGELPTKAKVTVSLGEKFKKKNLYMYYYNEEEKKLELYGYVISNEQGDISFEIDHCSDYVFIEDINSSNRNFVEDKDTIAYISGYPNGNFAPNKHVTRGEIAAMISRLIIEPTSSNTTTFNDTNMWAKEDINKLASYGYISGYEDGSFKPNNYITRAELAKIFINVIKPKRTQSFRSDYFIDIKDSWAKKEIMQCYRLGLINGYKGKFNPNSYATRAEVVTMINNLTGRTSNMKNKTNPFFDLDNNHWGYEDILRAIK